MKVRGVVNLMWLVNCRNETESMVGLRVKEIQ